MADRNRGEREGVGFTEISLTVCVSVCLKDSLRLKCWEFPVANLSERCSAVALKLNRYIDHIWKLRRCIFQPSTPNGSKITFP